MSPLGRFLSWFPRGVRLSDAEFDRRHTTLTALLLLQIPALLGYGLYVGAELVPLLGELAFPLVAGIIGWAPQARRRIRAFAVTAGLVYLSAALVHLSGGAGEATLHYLVMLSFIALYQDWTPFGWAIGFTAVSHLVLTWTQGTAGVDLPGTTTGAPELAVGPLVAAVLVASIGQLLAWKAAERQEETTVEAQAVAKEQEAASARRDAYAKMYVNLARRGQSLIDRQVSVIDDLERDVDDPDILARVFELDHLTTRVRRHGESLLVVAGVDLPAYSSAAAALVEVVRGAQSEVEHYRRVDVNVDDAVAVAGSVVRDLRHLIAELLENATVFSPPTTTVDILARASDDGGVVLSVADHGLGFDPTRLGEANETLANVDHVDEESVRHLGLRVVARLASKHGIVVELAPTAGGGTTAWIRIPGNVTSGAEVLPSLPPAARSAPVAAALDSEPIPAPQLTPPPVPSASAAAAPATPAPAATRPADLPPAPVEPTPAPVAASPLTPGSFSAKGSKSRRGRRKAAPAAEAVHAPAPPPSPPPAPSTVVDGEVSAPAAAAPAAADPAPALPRRARRGAEAAAPILAPVPDPVASGPAPALPRRERGASVRQASADEEAMDLFGQLDADASRSSLGAFQTGQRSARKDGDA